MITIKEYDIQDLALKALKQQFVNKMIKYCPYDHTSLKTLEDNKKLHEYIIHSKCIDVTREEVMVEALMGHTYNNVYFIILENKHKIQLN